LERDKKKRREKADNTSEERRRLRTRKWWGKGNATSFGKLGFTTYPRWLTWGHKYQVYSKKALFRTHYGERSANTLRKTASTHSKEKCGE